MNRQWKYCLNLLFNSKIYKNDLFIIQEKKHKTRQGYAKRYLREVISK